MIELVVFLGNPGSEYAATRHNAGWLLAQGLPFYAGLSWREKFRGRWAVMDGRKLALGCSGGEDAGLGGPQADTDLPGAVHFLMPGTFMNCSGESLAAASSFFKIKSAQILVVHDELELAPGTVSLKFSGGLGGHNGLRSVKACLGTADFWRLRIGIGRPDGRLPGEGGPPGSGRGIIDWVLSDFSAGERPLLESVLESAGKLLRGVLVRGPETFLPEWAKKKIEGVQ